MRYFVPTLLCLAFLSGCKPSASAASDGTLFLDCELAGTMTSENFMYPGDVPAPKATSEHMVLRITPKPFKIEQWADEKNGFKPLCGEVYTCKASQTDAQYRMDSTMHLGGKKDRWSLDGKGLLKISRTSGLIDSTWIVTDRSPTRYILNKMQLSGKCQKSDYPKRRF